MGRIYLLIFLLFTFPVLGQLDYAKLRKLMVEEQLKSRDIIDGNTLTAMEKVPRHVFVPKENRVLAYSDAPLSIARKQTISQPYMVAFMTQAIRPKRKHRVLEIGTGSGYQAAILGEIVDSVYTIEIIPELAKNSAQLLRNVGYENVRVKHGDGYHGWPEKRTF